MATEAPQGLCQSVTDRSSRVDSTHERVASRPYDHLWVLWRAPDDGWRFVVGDLSRASGGYTFSYADDLGAAMKRGFRLFTEFPHHRSKADPYVSRWLFPTFSQRVPSPQRPDYAAIL